MSVLEAVAGEPLQKSPDHCAICGEYMPPSLGVYHQPPRPQLSGSPTLEHLQRLWWQAGPGVGEIIEKLVRGGQTLRLHRGCHDAAVTIEQRLEWERLERQRQVEEAKRAAEAPDAEQPEQEDERPARRESRRQRRSRERGERSRARRAEKRAGQAGSPPPAHPESPS